MTVPEIREGCGDYLVQLLTEALITSVTASAQAAGLIRQGLLQDDPVKHRISLLVNNSDPDDTANMPAWSDGTKNEDPVFDIAMREIGGGMRWWTKFCVDVNCYLTRTQEDRDHAREIALKTFARAERALRNPSFGPEITDEFGNTVVLMTWDKSVPYASGGPPTSFIYRGKIYVKFLIESEAAAI